MPRAGADASGPGAPTPPRRVLREPAELSLWLIRPPLPDSPAAGRLAAHELDEAEARRAELFVRPQDRVQYLSAHIALRRILAASTGYPPDRLRLGREPGPLWAHRRNKPVLLYPPAPVHFSLSHSHGLILIGTAAAVVGVDVQRIPSPGTVEVCGPALHPAEWRELRALPHAQRQGAFARLWTRKEAYLKGLGTGLGRGPARDYLGAGTDADAPPGPPGWVVRDVLAGSQHAAAAALATPTEPVITLRSVPVACLYGGAAGQPLSAAPLLAWRRRGSWTLRWSLLERDPPG
ncbi:4'-phosphopantetheinyl transferase superfamily protein [Streptomyces sp. B-S-A8]|uniref:4'-phosphopantetheinyl transferase superfamily protein n=1 Tax=Streptomyces solicavernae TaxID=3043614 RepID=A0ABT6S0X5_9ACTN|nr:4'-phosphopantetheinyl transferase superfamily protein [Streptomyces sp. B-S-A8]MDI3390347.1 4'-phosphopantetheinyl transferase superfamily protein [Streptomyces sp. B-S-A8]